ncbi:MAG: response regulator [Lachnospiraceae bacterium]|nr:response regulator [Lachnospiraceae bacterium]
MIQILSVNRALKGGVKTCDGVDCNISASDTALHAFNQIIHIKPDIIVVNMDRKKMDVDMLVRRIKKMQAADGIPLLMLAEYEDDVAQYLDDGRSHMLPDDEEDEVILSWIVKKLGSKPKDQCAKILVVDDDPVVLETSAMFLGAKYDVRTTTSFKEALNIMHNERPGVVLLDIAMPEMDGREAIRKIKDEPDLADIPVLFQTGIAGTNVVKECLKLGAVGFVVKPLQKNTLLEKVSETLGMARGKKKKILMIDEFEFNLSFLAGLLQDCCDVLIAPATLFAINVLEEKRPDIVYVNADNSSYLIPKVREKANAYKIPLLLGTQGVSNMSVETELRKPNTFRVELPATKDSLLGAIDGIGEWRVEESLY